MAELNFPNIAGNFQNGYAFGAQMRQQKQADQDNAALRGLAPQIIAGDPTALAQGAAINSKQASEYGDVGVDIAKRGAGAAAFILDAVKRGNPQEIEGRYQAVVPFLTKIGAAQGKVPPPQFDPAMIPAMEQLVGMGKGANFGDKERPNLSVSPGSAIVDPATGQVVYERPYTPSNQTINVTGSDGRPVQYTFNTRTGSYEQASLGGGPNDQPAPSGGFGISETDKYVRSILGKANVDPNATPERQAEQLLPYVIQQESGGNPNAVSPKGAQGLMQVMPATGQDPGFGVTPLRSSDPQENVRFGREYLTAMLRRYPGRPDLALAAYNAGPGVADRFARPTAAGGGPLPPLLDYRNGGQFVGRTPEEQAALTTQAQEAAKLQFLPQQEAIKTAAAIEQAGGSAAAKGSAEARIEAIQNLPRVMQESNNAISLIDKALNHPGLATATGASGALDPRNRIPGTDAMDFRVLIDQLKGGTFLQAFQSLKGGGAITQVEGTKAEQAIARLDTAQSDEAFVESLNDLKKIAESALTRAQDRVEQFGGAMMPAQGASGAAPTGVLRWNPQTQDFE